MHAFIFRLHLCCAVVYTSICSSIYLIDFTIHRGFRTIPDHHQQLLRRTMR
jgi:hypothetical protein